MPNDAKFEELLELREAVIVHWRAFNAWQKSSEEARKAQIEVNDLGVDKLTPDALERMIRLRKIAAEHSDRWMASMKAIHAYAERNG